MAADISRLGLGALIVRAWRIRLARIVTKAAGGWRWPWGSWTSPTPFAVSPGPHMGERFRARGDKLSMYRPTDSPRYSFRQFMVASLQHDAARPDVWQAVFVFGAPN
jgi:hypothetical protein